jgi:hypothetical protein
MVLRRVSLLGRAPTLLLWRSFLEPTALFREPGALGCPADRNRREYHHKRDYDGVDKLPDQGTPRLAEDHGEQVLDSRVPCQGRHESQGDCDQLCELVEDFSSHFLHLLSSRSIP